jgi:hypothetical protein
MRSNAVSGTLWGAHERGEPNALLNRGTEIVWGKAPCVS